MPSTSKAPPLPQNGKNPPQPIAMGDFENRFLWCSLTAFQAYLPENPFPRQAPESPSVPDFIIAGFARRLRFTVTCRKHVV